MLPNPNFKWKQQPVIQVWRKQLDDKEAPAVKLDTYGSSSSVELFQEALRNNVVRSVCSLLYDFLKNIISFSMMFYIVFKFLLEAQEIQKSFFLCFKFSNILVCTVSL